MKAFNFLRRKPSSITPPHHPATAGQTYKFARVCAMFDKPYLALYTCGADGFFRHTETVKLEKAAGAGDGEKAQESVSVTVENLAPDGPEERCPWCGVKGGDKGGTVYCLACKSVVCRGRMMQRGEEEIFRCRASCGREVVMDYEHYHTDKGSKGPVARGSQSKETLPASDRNKLKA